MCVLHLGVVPRWPVEGVRLLGMELEKFRAAL